jgi:hypothetical protein
VVIRVGNDYWSCGTNFAGFGDSPSFAALTESGDPHTSSTDLSVVSSANAFAPAVRFENETYTTYRATGAVQGTAASGGGGTVPAASDVRSGTAVGVTTGTLAVPSAAAVLSGVSVDATTGTYVEAVAGDVRLGTTFGPAATYTGTLAVSGGGGLSRVIGG